MFNGGEENNFWFELLGGYKNEFEILNSTENIYIPFIRHLNFLGEGGEGWGSLRQKCKKMYEA